MVNGFSGVMSQSWQSEGFNSGLLDYKHMLLNFKLCVLLLGD